MQKRIKRQAIILIHGIGEQHPIVTLRDFVEAIAGQLKKMKQAREQETVFWDKPDSLSGNYETRKMTMRGGRSHPTTDFYEFYWAHHMRETNWSHIKDWIKRIVWRCPKHVSKRLQPVFYFIWCILLLLILVAIIYIYTGGINNFLATITSISSGIVATFLLAKLSKLLFNYLGDAGRYLDPAPGNIAERQAIREKGIRFLKNLHESGKYDRIILIGHSLGSIIAYDLVKFLWNEYYKSFDPHKFSQSYHGPDKQILYDIKCSEIAGKNLDGTDAPLEAFQNAQAKSHECLKAMGNKWLITDLVTIGSPLTHAGHLFIQKDELFEKLKEQREYPTCPPAFQAPDKTNIVLSNKFTIDGYTHPFQIKRFNHSSPFAVTKWTNIYYSSDFIGGPLKDVFGTGIKDIEVKTKNLFFAYPKGHTKYWDFKNKHHVLDHLWDILKE